MGVLFNPFSGIRVTDKRWVPCVTKGGTDILSLYTPQVGNKKKIC